MSTPAGPADLLMFGRVATLAGDEGWGWQPGVAVVAGRVLAVGPESELEALAGPRTRRWRLADEHAVMPGITDAHLHLMALALGESQIDLNGLGLPEALEAIRARDAAMRSAGDETGWLLGHGWSVHELGDWPTADDLERAAPRRAVALYAHDHHSRWVSHAALERAAVADVSDPELGAFIRRGEDGRPSGILHEWGANLVDGAITEPSFDEVADALESVSRRLLALGLTGCHDPGELNADSDITRGPNFYRWADEGGRLAMRVHSSIREPQLGRAMTLGLRSGANRGGRYTMGWLKLFSDGALGSRSAALLEPYSDADNNPPTGGPTGMPLMTPDQLRDALRRAEAAGIAVQVHAIGDGAVRTVLDAMQAEPGPRLPLRRRVEHAQLVDPADQPRFGRLGVAASVQPVHLRSDVAQIRAGWGTRGEHAFPLRALIDGGALIPFGTDAPVEPADPWPGIAVAVARREPLDASGAPLGAAHAITLERAIRAACVDPAAVAGLDDLGRLTAGSRADLLVVPSALFDEAFDAAAVASIRPLATLLDGTVVHRAGGFELE